MKNLIDEKEITENYNKIILMEKELKKIDNLKKNRNELQNEINNLLKEVNTLDKKINKIDNKIDEKEISYNNIIISLIQNKEINIIIRFNLWSNFFLQKHKSLKRLEIKNTENIYKVLNENFGKNVEIDLDMYIIDNLNKFINYDNGNNIDLEEKFDELDIENKEIISNLIEFSINNLIEYVIITD